MTPPTEYPRHARELSDLSARELLTRMKLSLEELQRRGIVRSRNASLADVSERIVWIARGGVLEPQPMKSHDVTTEAGQKIQLKARIMKTPSGKFSQFRSFGFDTAVFLMFAPVTGELLFARELTADEVTGAGARSEWVNATTLTGAKVLTLGTFHRTVPTARANDEASSERERATVAAGLGRPGGLSGCRFSSAASSISF